ncbi:MAG: DUF4294 domain-containing protein [Coprobacter sp.]|nr:DUF4294 domain-containing protein [Coprobacter sp.]
MKRLCSIIFTLIICLSGSISVYAQQSRYYQRITRIVTEYGDTATLIITRPVYCFPKRVFKNKKEKEYYWKNVRDVKKVLPYAKLVHNALIETYEYIQTLPEEERNKHLKRMEKELFEEYKPVLKNFTYNQARLLIRLIDRECNQSSYQLIKAFLGGFRATFWQTFGSMFGVSLRKEWEPDGKDKILEEIVILVENGQL